MLTCAMAAVVAAVFGQYPGSARRVSRPDALLAGLPT